MELSSRNSSAHESRTLQNTNATFRVVDAARMVPRFDAADLENYLHSFERICLINKWPKEHWSAILQTQLSGKGLRVFAELSQQECCNYDVLKAHLLLAYELCPEVYRKRFRTMTKFVNDTYSDFAFKMENACKRWLEGRKVYNDIEGLRHTFLLEQFFLVIPDDLKLWLTDKDPKTLQNAAQLADQFVALHKSVRTSSYDSNQTTQDATSASDKPATSVLSTDFSRSNFFKNGNKFTNKSQNKFKGVTCFYCKRKNHVISQCKLKKKHDAAKEINVAKVETSAVNYVEQQQSSSASTSAVCTVDDNVPLLFKPYCTHAYIMGNDGHSFPITILRDSGAMQSLLRKDAVPSQVLIHTGDTRQIKGIGNTVVQVPLVDIHLSASEFNGTVSRGLVDKITSGIDFLLGNDIYNITDQDVFSFITTRSMSDKLKVSDTLPDITSPQADDDISLASSLQLLEHSAFCSTDDIQNDNSTKAYLQQT